MPQINRIRVNNVKYNFGTQFYDDFIMRFNCRNTIYDLANGGGKSLLMLLLMQNMIPNCTLDEKQPIEKLFRKGSDNTCIHSLVEWKLDNNAVKDGFRYMTTGFCARKARDAKDEENVTDGTDTLTQAQASSSDNTSVEYFNYCIFYRKFGENDIKNLPLAVNGERVTYNGLKAYLREAEKSDYNIKVYIFDRKGDYQSFISRYGIYESAWEIVRGINKTEGHVRTYFETNYRTSRKVVEDLLIEEIIQKSYNNRLSVDNDDSMMAKTLLDIKDKLIELSKKNSQINDYDNQIEALTYFKDYIATYKEFYSNKSNIEDKLANMLLSVINAEGRKEAELSEHNEKEQELYNELSDKKYKIAVANVLKEKKSLNELDKLVKEALSDRNKKENQIKTAREKLMLLEAANNYCDYINYEKELVKVNTAIDSRMIEDEDIASELNRLAAIYKQYYDKVEKELSAKTARAAIDEKNLRDELKKADEKHQEDKNNCAVIQGQESAVKQQIEKDEKELKRFADAYGILIVDDIISKIEELRVQHNGILKAEALLEESIKETTKSVYKTEEKINIAESNIAMLDERIDQLQSQIISRQENESKLKDLQRIYGIAGADRLKEGIFKEFLRMNDKYNEDSQKAVKLGKLIEAVSAGSYYIDNPSYNKFREYLKSVCGEAVTEGYKYLENASEQQRKDIVKRIPFIQYSFVIDSGFDKLKEAELGTETQDSAVYPVISAEALKDENININSDKVIFAFNDISYLTDDKRRDVKVRILREELDNLNDTITKLNSRKQTVLEDYVLSVNAGDTSAEKLDAPEELLKRKNDIKENIAAYRAELGRYNDKKSQDMAELENVRKSKKSVELNISRYEEIAVVNERVTAGYVTLKQLTEQLKSAEAQIIECADYLDKEPDTELDIEMVFSNRDKVYQWLAFVYNTIHEPDKWRIWKDGYEVFADDLTPSKRWEQWDGKTTIPKIFGEWTVNSTWDGDFWRMMPQYIRHGYIFQQRAYALPDSDLPQSEIDNMKMEVKFLTAYAWWQLAENYGAIPFKPDYITPSDFTLSDLMIGQSPFDEVVDYCDQQMLEAANALPAIYDDPSKYGRINKIMALTVRSRMLLFAASPLVNGNEWYKDYRNKAGELVFNPTYDPNKWVKAAEACKLCIDEAEKAGYKLYVETGPTGENDPFMSTYNVHIKKWSEGNREITFPVTKGNGYFDFFLYGASTREFSGGGGQGVYQGLVDAFFTRRGLPILEDESYSEKGFSENVDKRNTSWSYGTGKEGEITAAGIYKMYCNREPRFYNAVSFHGSWQECAKRPYDFFYNGKDNIRTSSPHDAPQNGYLVRKSLCMTDNKKTGVYTSRQGFTYRLAFTYLDYAEANNEAYDTSAARELCLKYLNKVRERAGVRQYTFDAVSDLDENFIHIENTQAAVRKVVKAERRVELCLENNRWYDLRRWKDVENTPEMIGDDYGMNSEGTTNETFFKRTVYQTRVWKRCYYWMPVFIDEYEKNPNLVQTPFWLE